jgi:hypothetical protein
MNNNILMNLMEKSANPNKIDKNILFSVVPKGNLILMRRKMRDVLQRL